MAERPPDTPAAPAQRRAETGPRGYTVLLVDDNEDNRHIYGLYLAHLGFEVVTAEDAEAALVLATERMPDVVVMDVTLPGMDGYAATRHLKADPATAHIPVVVLTAHAGQVDRERAHEAGGDLYLSKPLDPATLGAELRALLGPARST